MAAVCNKHKPMKSELVAIYRLEFYKNKNNWKFSTERRENKKKTQKAADKSLNKTYDVETEAKANEAPPLNEAFIHEQPVDKKLIRSVLSDPGTVEAKQPSSDNDKQDSSVHQNEQVGWETECDTLHPDWTEEDPSVCMAYEYGQCNQQQTPKHEDLTNAYVSHLPQLECDNTNTQQGEYKNNNEPTKTENTSMLNTDLLATLVAKVRQRDLYVNAKDYRSLANNYKSQAEDYKSQMNDYRSQILTQMCDNKSQVGDNRGSQAEDYKSQTNDYRSQTNDYKSQDNFNNNVLFQNNQYLNFKPQSEENKQNINNLGSNVVPIVNENQPFRSYESQMVEQDLETQCGVLSLHENFIDFNQLLQDFRQKPNLDPKHAHYPNPLANFEPVIENPNPKLKYPSNYNRNIPQVDHKSCYNIEDNQKCCDLGPKYSDTQFGMLDSKNMEGKPQYKHVVPSDFVDMVNTCLCQMGVDSLPELDNCETLGSESRDFVRGAHTVPHSSETDLTIDCPCPSTSSLHVLTARQLRSALVRHLSAVQRLVAEHAHRTDLSKSPAPIPFEELDTHPTRDLAPGAGRGRVNRDKLHLIKIVRGRPYRL